MTAMFRMEPWYLHSFPKLGKIEITIDFNEYKTLRGVPRIEIVYRWNKVIFVQDELLLGIARCIISELLLVK